MQNVGEFDVMFGNGNLAIVEHPKDTEKPGLPRKLSSCQHPLYQGENEPLPGGRERRG